MNIPLRLTNTPPARARSLLATAVLMLALAACSEADVANTDSQRSAQPSEATASPSDAPNPESQESTQPSAVVVSPASEWEPLPERPGPRSETSGSVPHIQLDAAPVAEVEAELRRRAFLFPDVVDTPSTRSLEGARGLVFADGAQLAQPNVVGSVRELAHIHPDGSLHVWLPVDRAQQVHNAKWGEFHPWVERPGFWPGVVMLYTPESEAELEIVMQILVDAYNFAAGTALEVSDVL